MTSKQRSQLQAKIGDEGGVVAILNTMLQHETHAAIQAVGCGALRNLAYNNSKNKFMIANSGGIEVILATMEVHNNHTAVQKAGIQALRNLAEEDDNKVKIIEIGGTEWEGKLAKNRFQDGRGHQPKVSLLPTSAPHLRSHSRSQPPAPRPYVPRKLPILFERGAH